MLTCLLRSVACTLQLLCFFFIALIAFHPRRYDLANTGGANDWPEYFDLPVVALILITLLNDGTIISIAYDHVEPSKYPEKWNLPVSYLISGTLGGVAFAGSILYLHLMMDSHNPDGAWRSWGLGPITYGQLTAAMYLKVSLSDFLTLFSARTTKWFFSVRPDPKLYFAAFAALGASTALTSQWPTELNEKPLDPEFMDPSKVANAVQFEIMHGFSGTRMNGTPNFVLGVTWLYVFIWWIVQDIIKYGLYIVLLHFDVLQHKTAMFSNVRGDEAGVSEASDEVVNAAIGRVEGKLVAADVREAVSTLNTLERTTQETVRPRLADLEAAIKAKDEAKIKKASDEITATMAKLDKADAEKLRQNMVELKASADRAAKASGSMRKRDGGGGSFREAK